MKLLTLFFTGFLLLSGPCSNPASGNDPVSHQLWDTLLQKYVSLEGKVNYKGFLNEHDKLKEYLDLLSTHPPQNWSNEQKLAYWINAYNAFTVELILRNYPLKSIRDIKAPLGNPWKIDFIKIGEEKLNLDKIENEILRKQFDEPRIHFAINCASISCPVLRNEAYAADQIDQQLDEQATRFINDPAKNQITADEAKLSEIFNWYKNDFTKAGTLEGFISKYSTQKLNPDATITFMEYDWNLND